MQGLAYGLIFLNTPAAIVTYFVLPIASSIIFSVVPALQEGARRGSTWGRRSSRSSSSVAVTSPATSWPHLGTTAL